MTKPRFGEDVTISGPNGEILGVVVQKPRGVADEKDWIEPGEMDSRGLILQYRNRSGEEVTETYRIPDAAMREAIWGDQKVQCRKAEECVPEIAGVEDAQKAVSQMELSTLMIVRQKTKGCFEAYLKADEIIKQQKGGSDGGSSVVQDVSEGLDRRS